MTRFDFHMQFVNDSLVTADEQIGWAMQSPVPALRGSYAACAAQWLRCAKTNLRLAEAALRADQPSLKPLRLFRRPIRASEGRAHRASVSAQSAPSAVKTPEGRP